MVRLAHHTNRSFPFPPRNIPAPEHPPKQIFSVFHTSPIPPLGWLKTSTASLSIHERLSAFIIFFITR
jgi:hypothetical protein